VSNFSKKELSNEEKLMGGKVYLDCISYQADGGGDSLNEDYLEFKGIRDDRFDKSELKGREVRNTLLRAIEGESNLGSGWCNDEGGDLEFYIDFKGETINLDTSLYYNGSESKERVDEKIKISDIKKNKSQVDILELINQMKDNNVNSLSYNFYGSGGDLDVYLISVNGSRVEYNAEENTMFLSSGATDIVNIFHDGWEYEEGGNGDIDIILNDDNTIQVIIDMDLNCMDSENETKNVTFEELLSDKDKFEEFKNIIEAAKKVNDIIAEPVEKMDIQKTVNSNDNNNKTSMKL